MLNQPMWGARSLWMVTRKLIPVKIDEKPRMKIPSPIMITAVLWLRLCGV